MSVAAADVAIEAEGTGPLVLVPAACLPCMQQRELSARLRRSARLVFFAALEHGSLESPEDALTQMIARADAARERAQAEKVGLLGASSLGAVAVEYAVRCPDRVAFVVLFGACPRMSELEQYQSRCWAEQASADRRYALERTRAQQPIDTTSDELAYLTTARAYAAMGWFDMYFDPSPLVSGLAVPAEVRRSMAAAVRSIDVCERVAQLRCPTLIIHGRHDYVVPLSMWTDAEVPGGVTFETFDRSGHHPAYEEQQRFDDLVVRWIETLGGAAPSDRASSEPRPTI